MRVQLPVLLAQIANLRGAPDLVDAQIAVAVEQALQLGGSRGRLGRLERVCKELKVRFLMFLKALDRDAFYCPPPSFPFPFTFFCTDIRVSGTDLFDANDADNSPLSSRLRSATQ